MSDREPPQPIQISQPINRRFQDVDLGANIVRMAYDHLLQGVWVFITPLDGKTVTTHYFWSVRTKAWCPITFANKKVSPFAAYVFDGDAPGDRVMFLGGNDGYLRLMERDAVTDDGHVISSHVMIGPIVTKTQSVLLLRDLQATLGVGSGGVSWKVYYGDSPEDALSCGSPLSGTWTSGRNRNMEVQRAAHAFYIKISSTNRWMLEAIVARAIDRGVFRRRL